MLRRSSFIAIACLFTAVANAQLPPRPVVIRNVTLWDGTRSAPRPGQDVLLATGKISAIGPKLDAPKDADVVDGTGKFVIPGLADLRVQLNSSPANHIYLAETGEEQRVRWLHALLASGVTSVRLVQGGLDEHRYFQHWRHFEQLNSPDLFVSGPTVTASNGVTTEQYSILAAEKRSNELLEIKNTEELLQALTPALNEGLDVVELVYDSGPKVNPEPRISQEMLEVAVRVAHSLNTRVFCAVGHDQEAAQAVAAGCDAIEGVTEELLTPATLKAMAAKNVTFIPELAQQVDSFRLLDENALRTYLSEPIVQRGLSPLIQRSLDAKSGAIVGLRHALDSWIRPDDNADANRKAETALAEATKNKTPQSDALTYTVASGEPIRLRTLLQQQADRAMENVRQAHKAGVKVAVGTAAGTPLDFPGASTHREMELLVQAGFSPAEALEAATRNAAAALGHDKEGQLGTVQVGRRADLLLLDADPLADIHNTTRISEVFRGGRRIDREQMNQY